jgi:hypothetical protein
VTRAKADANISGVVGTKVYNNVPKDQAPPYLRIQWSSANDLEDKSSRFTEGELTFDFWTEQDGDKTVLEMMDYIYDEFNDTPLALTAGSTNLLIQSTGYNTFLEGDGLSHHGIMTFNLLIED